MRFGLGSLAGRRLDYLEDGSSPSLDRSYSQEEAHGLGHTALAAYDLAFVVGRDLQLDDDTSVLFLFLGDLHVLGVRSDGLRYVLDKLFHGVCAFSSVPSVRRSRWTESEG